MRVLSYPDLRDRKGVVWSRAHVYRMIKAGKFPRPLKLGVGTTAWLEEDIDRWLARRVTERDNARLNERHKRRDATPENENLGAGMDAEIPFDLK